MPEFHYTAVDAAGKRLKGVADGETVMAVADSLHSQGCLLLHADEAGKTGRLLDVLQTDLGFRRGLPRAAVAHFTRELSVMLQAGQDIDHTLRFLVETSEGKRARHTLQALRDQVRSGKSLASALAEHPAVFSRLYVSLVRAGEAGGTLADSLAHLADVLDRERRLAASIQSALTYPILLAIASIGTIILLLTYVLPQFAPIFAQAGAQMPAATRLLIGIGDVVRTGGAWFLAGLLAVAIAIPRALRHPDMRLAAERVLLKAPVVGVLIRRVQAARLTRTLGTLLRSGVNLVLALGIARDVLGSLTAARIADRAVSKVKNGERLAIALSDGHFFPRQTIHLLHLGEETGKLAEMALRAATIHEEQVQHTLERLVALLVPAITIVMGLLVAGIVGSLLVAMLSLNDLAL
jgi:general secretion pathway protein F